MLYGTQGKDANVYSPFQTEANRLTNVHLAGYRKDSCYLQSIEWDNLTARGD